MTIRNKNNAEGAKTGRNGPSHRLREGLSAPPELQNVVREANQLPLSARSTDAPQKKLLEASLLLDVAEDGFDGGTPVAIDLPAFLRQQFALHALLGRQALRRASARRAALFLFEVVGDRYEQFRLLVFTHNEVLPAKVAGVCKRRRLLVSPLVRPVEPVFLIVHCVGLAQQSLDQRVEFPFFFLEFFVCPVPLKRRVRLHLRAAQSHRARFYQLLALTYPQHLREKPL